ncbi:cytochrome b [Sphingomonas adhaesiva]|uniref:cytochrome b n=1 Tax=Sphingomonas adhaesiva TaxID=28212 RepID=UPI002FF61300
MAGRDEGRALRYSNVAIVLHWAIAALILYNLATGLFGEWLPDGAFAFHISSGITILVLTVVRVLWRLTHRPPPFLPMSAPERALAHGVHALLYVAMLALPLTGWAMVSANPPAGSPGAAYAAGGKPVRKRGPIMIWNAVPLPLIGPINEMGRAPEGVAGQRDVHERLETLHGLGGWLMLALLVLHVAGALKHQFIDRRRQLGRMGLGRA